MHIPWSPKMICTQRSGYPSERRMIRLFLKSGTRHFQVLHSPESPMLNYRRRT